MRDLAWERQKDEGRRQKGSQNRCAGTEDVSRPPQRGEAIFGGAGCQARSGGGRRNWKGVMARCSTQTVVTVSECSSVRLSETRVSEQTAEGSATVRRKLTVSRWTMRPAISDTCVREETDAGAARTTWSAHSAVVTATTARTCRVRRFLIRIRLQTRKGSLSLSDRGGVKRHR